MSKLALIFIGLFCLVQISLCANVKRDTEDVVITTESFLDTLKRGIERTFSEDNLKQVKEKAETIGEKTKDFLGKAGESLQENAQNFVKKLSESIPTTAAPVS